jgi:DNA-binding NarL/FixJ family response regulator
MIAEPGEFATDKMISVVIVEDHALFRKGLRAQFDTDSAIEVIAEFGVAVDAAREIPKLRPSVVLMDLHLPWTSEARKTYCGARAISKILKEWPAANIAVITSFKDEARVHEALKAGARSFVSKDDDDPYQVIEVVRQTARGYAVLNRVASEVVKKNLPISLNGTAWFAELSSRENDQLRLAAAGANDREIAEKLSITTKTVSNYWPNIRQKLGVPTRDAAVELARGSEPDEPPSVPGDPG